MSEVPRQLVDGATRIYGIIGDPVWQVKSPTVFNEKFRRLGKNAVMIALHVEPEHFDTCMRGLKSLANLDGLLVTLPYKSTVLAHVDDILPAAKRVGAANALTRKKDGRWAGDMFDGKGFLGGMRAGGEDPKGMSVMLIGAGGAGSAIADALAEAGASMISIFDRNVQKARALAARVGDAHRSCIVEVGPATVVGKNMLVNATPTGMRPGDGLPADFGPLQPELFVADIVPTPAITPLLALARSSGCRTMNGQAMVAGQAEEILRFFGLISAG